MPFETMIGTTGVASNGEKLFIANNTKITMIDRSDITTDIPHGYDHVEDIAVSGSFLAGIYVKDKKYGIFLLDLTKVTYTTKDNLSYEPYRIMIEVNLSENTPMVYAMDNKFKRYKYDSFLVEKDTIPGADKSYEEVDIAKGPGKEYFMSTSEIKATLSGNKLPIELSGDLLKIQLYLDHLFIIYLSHYNMYSIVQYNTKTQTKLNEIEGGYFSTRIYMCIHRNELYISSTLNRVIPLTRFSLSTAELGTGGTFVLFNTESIKPNLKEDTLGLDIAKMKERRELYAVDTQTAENSHFKYYVWSALAILFIVLIYISFLFPATGTVNLILLVILSVAALFILRSYI